MVLLGPSSNWSHELFTDGGPVYGRMSADQDDGSVLRTVTPLSATHEDAEMNVIGWVMFGLMLVVLIPLLPVIVVLWAVSKAVGR